MRLNASRGCGRQKASFVNLLTEQQRERNKLAGHTSGSVRKSVVAGVALLISTGLVILCVLLANLAPERQTTKFMADKNKELIALSENPAARFWIVDFSKLTSAEQVFVCVWELEAEVNNGGFEQYFHNSSGDNAQKVVGALQSIGANLTAKIVKQAIDMFGPSGPSAVQAERQAKIEKLSEEQKEVWNKLDKEFFAYPNNLTNLLHDFVMKNRNQIQGLGK